MNKRIVFLLTLNVVLLGAVVASLLLPAQSKSARTSEAVEAFFSEDVLSQLTSLQLGAHTLRRAEKQWIADDTYAVQPGKINTLLGILARMEAKRPIGAEELARLQADSLSYEVKLYTTATSDAPQQRMVIGRAGTEIWLKNEQQEGYYVYVPGLFFELTDYFNIQEASWRDRRILRTSWQTLQYLQVAYTGDAENSVQITFDSTFYRVEGVPVLDSAAVYNYIQLYEGLQVRAFLPENASLRDSLSRVTPLCKISVRDLRPDQGGELWLYPGPRAVYGKLLNEKDGELVSFDPRLLRTYLVNKEFFARQ